MSARRRRWMMSVGAVLAVLGIGGFLVALSGIVSLKASSGHWAITRAFIQFTKNRSIATRSLAIEVPTEWQPWQVLKGAGHYESGCRPCHGSPGMRNPRIADAMLPAPPYLATHIERRDPAELFYIIKHGLKFTGMPAWPSRKRDDEVWAMVAFLLEFPRLDEASYRRLVDGESGATRSVPPLEDLETGAAVPAVVRASCARCHGMDGLGRGNAAFPRLAGQKRVYLLNALRAFRDRNRHSGIMEPVAAALSESERVAVSGYYSALPSMGMSRSLSSGDAAVSPREDRVARGERIAREGIASRGIPACMECHGPTDRPRNAAYPELAGQYAGYIELQLALFASGHRGGSPYAHIMRHVAWRLDSIEASDVAAWYESLGARLSARER